MNPFTDPFPSFLLKGCFPGDLTRIEQKAREKFASSKKLNTRVERDGGLSTSTDPDAPHDWVELEEFKNYLFSEIPKIWNYWNYPPADVGFASSWVNLHPPGGWTDEHTHGRTDIVVVLYIKQPDNGGNLEIFDPMYSNWSGSSRVYLPWRELIVKTGDVFVFPGWVLHRTQKNQSRDDRIVLSINISSRRHIED